MERKAVQTDKVQTSALRESISKVPLVYKVVNAGLNKCRKTSRLECY